MLQFDATVLNVSGEMIFHGQKMVNVAADSATRTLSIPAKVRSEALHFVRLALKDATGEFVSTNTYWLSKKQTEFDWDKTDYTHTLPSSFEDLTALKTMPESNITARMLPANGNEAAQVELRNPSNRIAFQIALVSYKSGDKPYDSLLWSDNFIELLPGEARTLTAVALRHATLGDLRSVKVTGWNVAPLSIAVHAGR